MRYIVYMRVLGTATVEINADDRDHAMRIANDEYVDSGIPICHQCSSDISDPTYGGAMDAVLAD